MAEDTSTPTSAQQAVIAINNVSKTFSDSIATLNTGVVTPARMPGLTGDVTSTTGTVVTSITALAVVTAKINDLAVTTGKINDLAVTTGKLATNAVTNAKSAQMAAHTIKGNITGSTADPTDNTATQITAELNAVVGDSGSGGTKGLVPAPASGDTAARKYLFADGTFATTQVTGSPITTTSGTTHDFTGIPSGVKRITILLLGVSLSGTDSLLVQIGDSGGIETSGYVSVGHETTTFVNVASTAGYVIYTVSAAAVMTITMDIYNINGNSWVSRHVGMNETVTTSGMYGSGSKTLSATLDRVRLTTTGTNTFDAGTFNIIYE